MSITGTILFSTIERPHYGFDVFSVSLSTPNDAVEHRHTDGVSVNFNAQFLPNQTGVVFVSERTGSPKLYITSPDHSDPQPLPSISSQFLDRPIVFSNHLYFISAHENPNRTFTSWCALYTLDLHNSQPPIRLTPPGDVDFSPAISPSGELLAVATYGSRPWEGDFHELNTDIAVFRVSNPKKRVIVSRGGWPSLSSDTTVFFHRQAEDGWWSVYRFDFTFLENESDVNPTRITPPGVHCFTPAAFADEKRIAVATRRSGKKHRHIEIYNLETETFQSVTETMNPSFHHYNPFVSHDSSSLGYHRFRGESAAGETTVPFLEPIESPEKNLALYRSTGYFPSFSPKGDLIAMSLGFNGLGFNGINLIRSDGSQSWDLNLGAGVVFGSFWNPCEDNVIFTSIGSIFESARTEVHVARVTFGPLDPNKEETDCTVKILTENSTGNNAFPSCSPDGKFLVVRSGRSGYKNLYVIDAVDGEEKGVRRLTDGRWIDTMPCWSPKGDLIAFSSNRHSPEDENVFSIYTVRPDGSDLRRIHVADLEAVDRERMNHVFFSGDGKWLLFAGNLGGVTAEPVSLPNQFQPYGDLFAVRLDGSGLTRLTWGGYENGTPTWHPRSGGLGVDRASLISEGVGERLLGKFEEPRWLIV